MQDKFAMVPLGWADQPPPATALQVWVVLWQHRLGGSWPTLVEISDATGKSRAAIKCGIKWLEENRMLARVRGTGNTTSSYVLGWDPSKTKGVRKRTPRGSENEPPQMGDSTQLDLLGGQKSNPRGVRKRTPHNISKSNNIKYPPLGDTKTAPAPAREGAPVPTREVKALIDEWATALGKDKDPRFVKYTTKRVSKVKAALKKWPFELLSRSLMGWYKICEQPWRKEKSNRSEIATFFKDYEHVYEGLEALDKQPDGFAEFDTYMQQCPQEETNGVEKTDGSATEKASDPWMAAT